MNKYPVLLRIAFLCIPFALLHFIGLKFSLYWTVSWIDIVMHGFGGFLGALLVIYVLQKMDITGKTFKRKILVFLFVCISVIAVGAIWELWEIFTGMTDIFTDLGDTIMDLVMDTVGACAGFIYYDKQLKSKTE
jgi:uncharacterized membrane protein YjdF